MGVFFVEKNGVFRFGRPKKIRNLDKNLGGRVFLEKKLGMHGWGAYFSRKMLECIAGARISREKWASLSSYPCCSQEKWASLSSYPFFLEKNGLAYLRTPFFLIKIILFDVEGKKRLEILAECVFLEKKARMDGLGAYFSKKKLDWMARGRMFREKG